MGLNSSEMRTRRKTMNLVSQVQLLKSSPLRKTVDRRLAQFRSFRINNEKEWFSELCFCILTANSKALSAISIQKDLGPDGFVSGSKRKVLACIKKHKHRFHNNKTSFIMEARDHIPIKKKITGMIDAGGIMKTRDWLARNIKGIGYKEASHFLRNVGYEGIAILDRHIINLMIENGYINKPSSLTGRNYLDIERRYFHLADKAQMTAVELDLYMWYMKTGEVLK